MKLNTLEIKRQLLHVFIGTLVLFLLVIGLLKPLHLFILIVVSGLLSVLSKHYRVPIVSWFLDNFEREKDKEKFPGRGFIAFFVGTLLAIKLFQPLTAYASIMVLTLGDTVSHLIGAHIGITKHPLNGLKSLEGSIAGSFAGAIGALYFVNPIYAVIGSFGAMAAEAVQVKMNNTIIDDNIIVPLACGAIIMLVKAVYPV